MDFIQIAGQKIPLPLTAFGDLRTAELTPIFQGSFEYTVDNTEISSNIISNGGTVTQASAMAVTRTSATTNSTACLRSKRHARYRAGFGGLLRFTALFTAGVALTEQYIGLLDETGSSAAFKNGLAIGFNGTDFGFHRFSNDIKNSISQTAWDDPLDGTGTSGATLDATKINVWYISFQFLGAGAINLHWEKPNGDVVIVHTIQYAGANIEPSSFNPNYQFTTWVNNKATTSDLIIKSSSYGYFTEGKTSPMETHQTHESSGHISKSSITSEIAILTIRNKATYAGKTNFIEIMLELISASIEASSANNLADIRVLRNTTLGGTPSFSDINTNNSVMEIDIAGTTVTGGTELFSIPLAGKNDSESLPVKEFAFLLEAGETFTITASSANSATIDAAFLWKELF